MAVNVPLDGPTAEAIAEIFTEVVIAPGADEAALAVFSAKKNLRLLLIDELPDAGRAGFTMKTIAGGLLVQSRDNGAVDEAALKVVTKRAPTDQELKDCLFAWTVAKHVKSNAIVYAKDGVTAGIGAGQMNRRDSSRIAAIRAKRSGRSGWLAAIANRGQRRRLRRILPFSRRFARCRRSRGHGHYPAGRFDRRR